MGPSAEKEIGMKIEEIWHSEYGKCLQFSNGAATLAVTLDYGPRIIHYSLAGSANIMFFNRYPSYRKYGPDFDRIFYPGAYWNIRGGNRLWIAPHSFPHAFYPDNDPVEYEPIERGARFTPPPRMQIGAQVSIEVSLAAEGSRVAIHHTVRNIGKTTQRWAAWSITSVDAGGFEIIPMSDRQTGVLPNRHVAFWPYTDIGDSRIALGNRYAILRHDAANPNPLKIGFNAEDGWASYVVHSQCFTLQYSTIEGAEYPDFGVTYETFADDRMVEMEALSPLKTLRQGESVSLSETWSLTPIARKVDAQNPAQVAEFAEHLCRNNGENP